MKPTRLLIPAFAVVLLASAGNAFAQQYDAPPEFQYGHHGTEEAMEHRGFYDGVRGADRDFENHRRPNVNNRDEYRDPDSIPGWAQHEYREGFRRGYYVGCGRSITAKARSMATRIGTGTTLANW